MKLLVEERRYEMDLPYRRDEKLDIVGLVGNPGELIVVETGKLDAELTGGGSSQPVVLDEED